MKNIFLKPNYNRSSYFNLFILFSILFTLNSCGEKKTEETHEEEK